MDEKKTPVQKRRIRTGSETKSDTDTDTGGAASSADGPRERGGPRGPDPTRYGDWERKGRCIDF